jgi:nucleoside-diphosphate-sugar epimerase
MSYIIGNGLIANAFRKLNLQKNLVFFASGVSNSNADDSSEFEREFKLIETTLSKHPNLPFIYFSTCSIYQKRKTLYISHKLKVEKFITEHIPHYYIFRLPQLVGVSERVNKNTLINFFIKSVYNNEEVKIQKNSTRYLLDIDDFVEIISYFINNEFGRNKIINIAPAYKCSAIEIFQEICKNLNKYPSFHIFDTGESYPIPIELLSKHLSSNHKIFSENYWKFVIQKNSLLIFEKFRLIS